MMWDQKKQKLTFHLCQVRVELISKILLKVIWETVGSLLVLLLQRLDQGSLTELLTLALMQVEITAISSGEIEFNLECTPSKKQFSKKCLSQEISIFG